MPALTYNMEAWTHYGPRESKKLEQVHAKLLRVIFNDLNNTPYTGLIMESGIWPIMNEIEKKKLLLYHNIIKSDEKRLINNIIKEQIKEQYSK